MDSRNRADPDTLPWRVTFVNTMGEEKDYAAFRYEGSYQEYLAMCWQVTFKDIVRHLVDRARRSTITIEVGGVEGDVIEAEGALPYDQLLAAFKEGIKQIEELKHHEHWWSRDESIPSYCMICGKPGDI